MIAGNALAFIAVIVFVCLVDFSTISLGDLTERLYYYDEGGDEKQSEKRDRETVAAVLDRETEAHVENGVKAHMDELDDIRDKISDLENTFEGKEKDILENHIEGSIGDLAPVDEVAEQTVPYHNLGNIVDGPTAEKKPARKRIVVPTNLVNSGYETKHEVNSSSLKDDLGMSSDFCDDFTEMSDLIFKIHEEGKPS